MTKNKPACKNRRKNFLQRKRRRRNFLLKKQNGACYYCSRPMTVYPKEVYSLPNTPDDAVTLEHLYDKYHPYRKGNFDLNKTVLACYKCNHTRGRTRYLEKRDENVR